MSCTQTDVLWVLYRVNVLTGTVSPINMLEAVNGRASEGRVCVASLPFEVRTPLLLECSQTLQSVFSWYHLGIACLFNCQTCR